jgi:hypothetical protein
LTAAAAPGMARRIRNAILAISADHVDERDFRRIAQRARELAPDVRAYLAVAGRRNRTARLVQLLRPTLLVEIEPVPNAWHLRGRKLACAPRPKLESLAFLRAAGLPVPRFAEVTPGLTLDPAEWGPYVVVKPSGGWRGAFVRIQRTGRVRYKAPEEYPDEDQRRMLPMLAQRFVYTGRWPVSYRVLSFLGEPLHAMRYEGSHDQPPLDSPDAFPDGITIVASSKRASVSLAPEQDLLDLARRIHAAMPERPVLGIDLIRDATSGELFIAEVNERHCWTLSSESGRQMQRQFGLDFYAQYDAIERAAEALVRRTREWAR